MTDFTANKVVILGLGMIGASLAAALQQLPAVERVTGWGRRPLNLDIALKNGLIDDYSLSLEEALNGADIAIIATPTLIAEQSLKEVIELAGPRCVISDVASTKGNLANVTEACESSNVTNVVLAHPIAGSEQSGAGAANAELFQGRKVIITPLPTTNAAAQLKLQNMWLATGADVVSMSVDEHDKILAATSHLPHILAYSLVEALSRLDCSEDVFRFAAGGFKDFTRIASSDPQMWAEISVANKSEILSSIDYFQGQLSEVRSLVENAEPAALENLFDSAKQSRDHFLKVFNDKT